MPAEEKEELAQGPQGKGQPHSSLELQPWVQVPVGPFAPLAQPPQESGYQGPPMGALSCC